MVLEEGVSANCANRLWELGQGGKDGEGRPVFGRVPAVREWGKGTGSGGVKMAAKRTRIE